MHGIALFGGDARSQPVNTNNDPRHTAMAEIQIVAIGNRLCRNAGVCRDDGSQLVQVAEHVIDVLGLVAIGL